MQEAGNAALADAIASADRQFRAVVQVDWDRDGTWDHSMSDLSTCTDEFTVERTLTGALPAECTVTEGYSAAKLTVRLSGQRAADARPLALMLAPYRSDSPLFGTAVATAPIRADIETLTSGGWVSIRQFSGTITDLSVDAADRTIEITALDGADSLRAAITLAVYGRPHDNLYLEYGSQPARVTVNSHWVIDYVLRKNGIYQSPPPQSGCVWSATGHGGLINEMADQHNATLTYGGPPVSQTVSGGPFGLAMYGGPDYAAAWQSWMAAPLLTGSGNNWSIQLAVRYDGAGMTYGGLPGTDLVTIASNGSNPAIGTDTLRLQVSDAGVLSLHLIDSGSYNSALTGPTLSVGWHTVAAHLKFAGASSAVTWVVDGVTTGPTTVNLSAWVASPAPDRAAYVTASTRRPMQCVQICQAATTAGSTLYGTTWTSQADVDLGANDLISLPDEVGADSWEVVKRVADAEFGVVGFSESGRFYFRNRRTVREQNLTVDKTISAAASLVNIRTNERADSVRNEVTMTITPRLFSGAGTVFAAQSATELVFPAGVTRFTAVLTKRAVIYPRRGDPVAAFPAYTSADWDTFEPLYGYVANSVVTGLDIGGVSMTFWQLDDTHVEIEVTNTNTGSVAMATEGAQPAFRLLGVTMEDDPVLVVQDDRPDSIARFERRVLEIPANPYRQQVDSVGSLITGLLNDLDSPMPVIDRIPIIGDPRLQMGDTAPIQDPDGVATEILTIVTGITTHFSGGLTQELSVRPFARPNTWILGHSTLGVLGSTTRLG